MNWTTRLGLGGPRRLALMLILVSGLGLSGCSQAQWLVSQSPLGGGQQVQLTEPRTVPLRVVESPGGGVLAFVPIHINDQGPYDFALDTGASHSVIDGEIARGLELPEIGRTAGITGVTGTTDAAVVRVEQWRLGDVALPSTIAVRLDLPDPPSPPGIPGLSRPAPALQGLLGSDILSRFGSITVDYDRRELTLRPHES